MSEDDRCPRCSVAPWELIVWVVTILVSLLIIGTILTPPSEPQSHRRPPAAHK